MKYLGESIRISERSNLAVETVGIIFNHTFAPPIFEHTFWDVFREALFQWNKDNKYQSEIFFFLHLEHREDKARQSK